MVYMMALTTQPFGHLVNTIEWRLDILFVYQLHQQLVIFCFTLAFVVQTAAAETQQFALSINRYLLMARFDSFAFLLNRQIQIFF